MPYKNAEDRRTYQRSYYHKHKQLYGPRKRNAEQREKQRRSQRRYDKRRAQQPYWKLRNRLRVRLRQALRAPKYRGAAKKAAGTLQLLGCSTEQLRAHLQARFTKGMNWDNYGKWHIDHIIPCAAFDLQQEEQQRQCFHFTNLQPLWAIDNLKKGAQFSGCYS